MERISHSRAARYGVLEWGTSAAEFVLQVYLLIHFAQKEGLSPATAGQIAGLVLIWDAISDPLMGYLSDHTRWGLGKRRPYFLLGSLLLPVSLLFLFFAETGPFQDPALRLFWGLIGTNSALTLSTIPHLALASDQSSHSDNQDRLYAWRFLFTNLGLLSAVLLPLFGSLRQGLPYLCAWILISGTISFIASRPLEGSPMARPTPMVFPWRLLLRDRALHLLLFAFFCGALGRSLNSSLALFYYQFRLGLPERTVFLQILLPFALVIAPSILLWARLARSYPKASLVMWAIGGLGLGGSVAYPWFPSQSVWGPGIFAVVGGVLVGSIFLFDALMGSLAALRSKEQDQALEGLYFGLMKLSFKLSRALGLWLTGQWLSLIGVTTPTFKETHASSWGLALLFGPGVGVFFVLAAALAGQLPKMEPDHQHS